MESVSIFHQRDFRRVLKAELETRSLKNPRYSLRSFARDIGLSASRLSEVLNGRYGLSRKSALEIGDRLGWAEKEKSFFGDLVESQHSRSKTKRELAKIRLEKYKQNQSENKVLLEDVFKTISDWYHFAILELTKVQGFQPTPSWISKALGISQALAKEGVDRLLRLDLLEEKDGTLVASTEDSFTTDGIPSTTVKRYQEQLIQKAKEAIWSQPIENRDMTSMVLSFNKIHMDEAKEDLRKFRREFAKKYDSEPASGVYCLALHFFELTQPLESLSHRGENQ